jgi:tetratricopeptide (TPR) repeat protein/transcriptional regulator with XRE-family HTH domain
MPDAHRLYVLIHLRKSLGLSLAAMARSCGLSGRRAYESASAWERGLSVPHPHLRAPFLRYLANTLGLRADPQQLQAVWQMLAEEWHWELLSAADWRALDAAQSLPAMPVHPVHNAAAPERAALPPGSLLPFAPNPHFVGRSTELRALDAQLQQHGALALTAHAQAALVGPGGVGKTQLAIEFAHRYGHRFTGGVFWISFADPATVPAAVAACGAPTALNLRPDFAQLGLDIQVQLVLAAWQAAIPRLLIFDNCEDAALLRRWLPRTGGCRVLITSRRSSWEADLSVVTLPLGLFSRSESLALLRHYAPGSQLRDDDLIAIAAELDDLPLALHLAGSYLTRGADTLTPHAYLAEVRQALWSEFRIQDSGFRSDGGIENARAVAQGPSLHRSLAGVGLHGRPLPTPTGHLNHIEQTIALSLARLDRDDPDDSFAYQLLLRAAWLAPGELIPLELLGEDSGVRIQESEDALPLVAGTVEGSEVRSQDSEGSWRGGDGTLAATRAQKSEGRSQESEDSLPGVERDMGTMERRVTLAVQRLVDSGLLLLSGQQVRLHRLVVAFLRQHAVGAAAQTAVEELLLKRMHTENLIDNHPALLALQPHLISVTNTALRRGDLRAAALASELSWHLHQVGTTEQTLAYNQRSLAIRQAMLGANHPELATNLHSMGWTYDADGRYEQALGLHQRGLAIRRAALGAQHRDVAISLNFVGMIQHALCDYATAQGTYADALAVHYAQQPRDEPEIAELLNNIGLVLIARGRYHEARPYLEQALQLREDAQPHNRALLAVTVNNIGYLLRVSGEFARARSFLERALALRRTIFGPENAYIAVTLSHLARLEHIQAQYALAWSHFEECLTIRRAVYDALHPDTAHTLSNLGMVLVDQGEYVAAQPYLEAALAMHRQTCGDQHRHTARSLNHLGMLHQACSDPGAATRYFRDALAIRRRVLGATHHDTANTLSHLGMLRLQHGHAQQALPLVREALRCHQLRLGDHHHYTARSQLRMAQVAVALGEHEAAEFHAHAALTVYRSVFGVDHPFTLVALDWRQRFVA